MRYFRPEDMPGGEVPCPDDIQEIVGRMELLMGTDQRYNHAGVPQQVALDLMKVGRMESFAQFETWLRQLDSKIHFVAVPLEFYGLEWVDKTKYPLDRHGTPEYTMWVGVNGEREAEWMLRRLGITEQENRQRLLTTGILMADPEQ